jgi:hypothetical protein
MNEMDDYATEYYGSLYITKYLSFTPCASKAMLEHVVLKVNESNSFSLPHKMALWKNKTRDWLGITMEQEGTCSAFERIGLERALGTIWENSLYGDCVLTVDLMNEFHRSVLFFDLKRRGYIRRAKEDSVWTYCEDLSIHTYPQPESVHSRLTCVCDIVNYIVFEWHRRFKRGALTAEALELYVKLCAWTFHRLVSLHPYLDGNGRTARLAVAHLLATINPFPVPFAAPTPSLYLQALVGPRSNTEWDMTEEPTQLSNMILESWFQSWQ